VELVSTTAQVAENLYTFGGYRTSSDPRRRSFYLDRLRLGKQFVVAKSGAQYLFAPSRFAGYADCTYERHVAFPHKDGKLTTPRLTSLLGKPTADTSIESIYLSLCEEVGAIPALKERTYWLLATGIEPMPKLQSGEPGFPDEVAEFVEGATKRVVVNAYERDPKARSACLIHHGYSCVICQFNFADHFGEIGKDFIHVHHLDPISKAKEAHTIDPVNDLRPVCPNCHAMLHHSDPPFTIEELIAIRAARNA
jgi:5-methylcytosine-specific restriction enzyme A